MLDDQRAYVELERLDHQLEGLTVMGAELDTRYVSKLAKDFLQARGWKVGRAPILMIVLLLMRQAVKTEKSIVAKRISDAVKESLP